jgi:peroxiredoxin
MALPSVALPSTSGRTVDLSTVEAARVVVYAYPMTSRPGQSLPPGWDGLPGTRGCTAEACAFRDHRRELGELGASVFGLSTQSTDYQREMVARLHVPFEVLSDEQLRLADAMRLPTFTVAGVTYLKRLSFVAAKGRIEKVFYPVFPVASHADEVIAWLRDHLG